MYIVVLDVPSGVVMRENVFGMAETGDIIWQIESLAGRRTSPTNRYTGIVGYDDQTAVVFNCHGFDVRIDVHSGKVVGKEFTK